MNLDEFIKKYCDNCNEICDKGIKNNVSFIRCIDRQIYEKTNENKN